MDTEERTLKMFEVGLKRAGSRPIIGSDCLSIYLSVRFTSTSVLKLTRARRFDTEVFSWPADAAECG